MTLQPGQSILNGDYVIIELIGKGAFGEVYRARHVHLNEERAIKVLRRDMDGVGSTQFNTARNRFRLEASLGSDLLKHDARRIVKVLDFRESDGELYLIMEYMPGRSLADKLKSGALPINESIRIAHEVAQGLAELHALDAVHRDVKPSNILFDAAGRAKLGDLGLAQTPAQDSFRNELGSAANPHPGTPAYMSPEQETTVSYLRPTSDVYSLGLVIFEMLTGRNAKNLAGANAKKLRPQVPDELDALAMRMLEYDPSARPQDGADAAQLLRQFIIARRKAREEREQAEQQQAQRMAQAEADRTAREEREAAERLQAQHMAQEGADRITREKLAEQARLDALRKKQDEAERIAHQKRAEDDRHAAQLKAQAEAQRRERQRQNAERLRTLRTTLRPWLLLLGGVAAVIALVFLGSRLFNGGGATAMPTAPPRAATIEISKASTAAPVQPTFTVAPTDTPAPVPPTATTAPTPTTAPPPTLIPNELIITLPGKVEMVLVRVQAGEFRMGSTDSDKDAQGDEKPQHKVTLDEYWIGKTEVTNAQFGAFVNAQGYKTTAEKEGNAWAWTGTEWKNVDGANWQHPQGPSSNISGKEKHPVVSVSWDDAAAFCKWASEVSGKQVRLPTEAEWEKTARGGVSAPTATTARIYPWGDDAPNGSLLNYADKNLNVSWADKTQDDGYELTAPVGSYPKGTSPYGALDMAGNVWEWVADRYAEKYYATSPASNPTGADTGQYRVLRGGSWYYFAFSVRAAYRFGVTPSVRYDYVGFRVAVSSAPVP